MITFEGPIEPEDPTLMNELLGRYVGGLTTDLTALISNNSATGTPACSNALYNAGAQGVELATSLSYPDGAMNLTTESVVEISIAVR